MDNEEKVTSEEEKEETEEISKKSFKKKLEKKDEEIASLKAQVDHWKNEYYRAYADTQNLRKSLEKEHKDAIKYRIEGLIDNLLPVLDSFFLALETKPANQEIANYLVGFQYIYKNLMSVLENEGVKEIYPKIDEKFDANTMNAIETIEDENENLVKKVYTRGYTLHDRVVRPAGVMVSVAKKEENDQ
ncbi:MAG: nucleotide exchange factor GrpE [Bacilli bacterium]